MFKIVLMALTLLAQPQRGVVVSATATGLSAAALTASTYSNSIAMHASQVTNQLALTFAVTEGTSLVMTVRCQERATTAEGWQHIALCDGTAAAACEPDVRTFTFTDYTAVSGVTWVTSRWSSKKPFVRCIATGIGNGTYVLTGWRSWQ